MLVKIWLPIFYHLPHNLTQFLQNQPILPNFAFSTLSVDSGVQFSAFICWSLSQYSQVPHLLSIGRCRQASSDAFNKLRNLSLSHRKIHRRVSQYSILNTNHHHHDLLAIFNNGWHLSPPPSPPSSPSVTTSPFLTMPIIRLKDGDSGVAISRGLPPTLFTQAQTEYFSFTSYHHSTQTK